MVHAKQKQNENKAKQNTNRQKLGTQKGCKFSGGNSCKHVISI